MTMTREKIEELLRQASATPDGYRMLVDVADVVALAERALEPQGQALPETKAWLVDFPDEPELGFYFSEEENKLARSRALVLLDDVLYSENAIRQRMQDRQKFYDQGIKDASQLALPAGPVHEGYKLVPTQLTKAVAQPFKKASLTDTSTPLVWSNSCADAAPSPAVAQPENKHDWPEDWPHENGKYLSRCHQCHVFFTGHKRRVTCKVCASPALAQPVADERGIASRYYRKKPVVIEAVQYTEAVRDAHLFDGALLPAGVSIPRKHLHPPSRKVYNADAFIETLEGRMEVSLNDWIITGIKGEHYACKPDIFATTYEPARAALCQPADEGGKS